jgi:hypothetical protein
LIDGDGACADGRENEGQKNRPEHACLLSDFISLLASPGRSRPSVGRHGGPNNAIDVYNNNATA